MRPMSCFNPRTHTGCDKKFLSQSISTWKFQSTHPHGVRQAQRLFAQVLKQFQSTHPHGVRLSTTINGSKAFQFQSTHPHGVRLFEFYKSYQKQLVSIHAPTRGATYIRMVRAIRLACFNPRTHTGCDIMIFPNY